MGSLPIAGGGGGQRREVDCLEEISRVSATFA